MANSSTKPSDQKLSPKRREALEKLRDGGLMVADKYNLHYINDWQVVPQNYYWLAQNRLIRVLDPTRKSGVKGNGHVISEKGLALLAELDQVAKNIPENGT